MKSGKWWSKQDEIDIVAFNQDENRIVFGECKYVDHKVEVDVYYHLKKKSERVIWMKDSKKHYIVFSKSGFDKTLSALVKQKEDLYLYNL